MEDDENEGRKSCVGKQVPGPQPLALTPENPETLKSQTDELFNPSSRETYTFTFLHLHLHLEPSNPETFKP